MDTRPSTPDPVQEFQSPELRLHRFVWAFVQLAQAAARWPVYTLAILAATTIYMALGLLWVSTDDALENFLKAKTPDYLTFERMRERFPSSDLDVFVVVEGDDLFSAASLSQMQELNFALLLSEDVKSVVSIFSLKEALQAERLPESIIPDEIPDNSVQLRKLAERVATHPLARDRLISTRDATGQLALFVVALNTDQIRERGLPSVLQSLNAEIGQAMTDSDLRFGIGGVPAMKAEVIAATARDIVVFNAAGLLVGAVICWLFFRRLKLVLISNAPALVAIVCCLGLFGWSGIRIDPLMNAIMPLVIVVTFNNAMHFLFAICRQLDTGSAKPVALSQAISEIAPACSLTSITTSIALLSLVFSSSPLISDFGGMAGICILVALILVLVIMPLLAAFFLEPGQGYLRDENPYHGVQLLNALAARLSQAVARQPMIFVVGGIILTVLFFVSYIQLEPRYRLSDMLPDQGQAATVTERMEERLKGVFPINVLVELPAHLDAGSPEAKETLDEIQEALVAHPSISKVSSLRDLQKWAASGNLPPEEANARLFETVPPEIKSRFIDTTSNSLLVSGYIEDLEAKEILEISEAIEEKLDGLRTRHPEMAISLTGLSSIAAKRSTHVIAQLRLSMMGAIVVVVAVIGLAFQSVFMAGLSIIPNIFALFATGTWLLMAHGGLDYATIVGLTVAFGLAVDDTIHVLNRYDIEKHLTADRYVATDRTLRLIGTVLILTTVVLLAGLSVTQLSTVPPTRQFGLICIITLAVALVGDLVVLPALILVCGQGERLPRPGGRRITRKIAAAAEGAAQRMRD
jgi:uncharacterized protein